MNKSDSGNCLSSFPYAEEMADLLDSRPIYVQEIIDSWNVSSDSTSIDDSSKDNAAINENTESNNKLIIWFIN